MSGRTWKRTAFPRPPRTRCNRRACAHHNNRPASVPAGEKRPPWAGRALAACLLHAASAGLMSRMASAMANAMMDVREDFPVEGAK